MANSNGERVVTYTYDAWGKLLSTTGSQAATLGQHNPLRYRGYVYDQETGLYYLQSRYYNPEMGRFLNADSMAATGQGMLGNNMFAYCQNNPVIYEDQTGTSVTLSILLAALIGGAINVATTFIAAKATVQEYTITDAAAAFAVGMINAYGGPLAGGLASGLYAAFCALNNGAAPATAAVCFAVSGSMTAFSIGNLANLGTSSGEALFATAAADMSFGSGYNMISAATYKTTVKQPQLPSPWDSNAFYPSNGLYNERLQSILDGFDRGVFYGN